MSGGWQSVCTRPREKSQNPTAEMFFCGWNCTLCLKIRSIYWFELRAGAHHNSVALGCFLLWDARLVFYLLFSLFLNELCPVCCTRQRMLMLCSLQVGCCVFCSLLWNSAPKSLCVYRVSSIPCMHLSVALCKSRQNKYSCIAEQIFLYFLHTHIE